MSLTIPHIAERLPAHRERILQARFQTELVDELCRDYDTVRAALDGELSEENRLDLLQLADDLEREMLDWLNAHQDAISGG
jgi:hypothetical protein